MAQVIGLTLHRRKWIDSSLYNSILASLIILSVMPFLKLAESLEDSQNTIIFDSRSLRRSGALALTNLKTGRIEHHENLVEYCPRRLPWQAGFGH